MHPTEQARARSHSQALQGTLFSTSTSYLSWLSQPDLAGGVQTPRRRPAATDRGVPAVPAPAIPAFWYLKRSPARDRSEQPDAEADDDRAQRAEHAEPGEETLERPVIIDALEEEDAHDVSHVD